MVYFYICIELSSCLVFPFPFKAMDDMAFAAVAAIVVIAAAFVLVLQEAQENVKVSLLLRCWSFWDLRP